MIRGSKKYYNTTESIIDSEMEFGRIEEFKENTEKSSAPVKANGPQTKNGIISNALLVKVRKEPNLSSDVLEVLQKGEKVIILERVNKQFYKISTKKNDIAYIFVDFLKEE